MVNSTWAWPAAETVHFLGLSLSFGVLLAVNLRILGVMRQVAFADVHRLLPWGMLGFGANLITGMLFFIGQPRAVHRQRAVLLEGRLPDDRRRELSLSDGVQEGLGRDATTGWTPAWLTRPWRSRPSSRGSPCCMRDGCFRSSATPSDAEGQWRSRYARSSLSSW